MSLDSLLLWASAKAEGSWAQFRGAVEEHHVLEVGDEPDDSRPLISDSGAFPVYRQAQATLKALSHMEFAGDGSWRVVPPTLAVAERANGEYIAILCGARTPRLLELLQAKSHLRYEATNRSGVPDRIRVFASALDSLKCVAANTFYVQESAPSVTLLVIPRVDNPQSWRKKRMPNTPGWLIHRFSPSTLKWEECAANDAFRLRFGLFRFVQGFQRFYFLTAKGSTYEVPVQVGKFVALNAYKRRVVGYSSDRTFRVPAMCRPPLFVERALILCSGLLPSVDRSGLLEYQNISPDVAALARRALCQGAI